jgi:hypothetical protein
MLIDVERNIVSDDECIILSVFSAPYNFSSNNIWHRSNYYTKKGYGLCL